MRTSSANQRPVHRAIVAARHAKSKGTYLLTGRNMANGRRLARFAFMPGGSSHGIDMVKCQSDFGPMALEEGAKQSIHVALNRIKVIIVQIYFVPNFHYI